MIKINIKNNNINISGHALYDDYGKDIVCASVSSIVICTINGILALNNEVIEVDSTKGINITILKENDTVKTLLKNMINLLKELETKYTGNIKINE